MSRAWRIEYEGALYHIFSRGNRKKDIFFDNDDRRLFLSTIDDMSQRFGVQILCYVLMSNHYHLLVKTKRANLKTAMHWFGTTYTQRFNTRHSIIGHLFQGRYKSILVENEDYMLLLSCYIHRNPLRANYVERLADYRWSSYLAYAYGQSPPSWLSTELILSQLNPDDPYKSYREKVQRYAKEEKQLWENFRHGLFLGSKRFVETIRDQYLPDKPHAAIVQQKQLANRVDPISILNRAQQILNCEVKQIAQSGRVSRTVKDKRDLMIYLLWKTGALSHDQIGQIFGISYSAVSHAVKSLKIRLKDNRKLRAKLKQLYSLFKL